MLQTFGHLVVVICCNMLEDVAGWPDVCNMLSTTMLQQVACVWSWVPCSKLLVSGVIEKAGERKKHERVQGEKKLKRELSRFAAVDARRSKQRC